MTADDKCSFPNRDNLMESIQILLSEKEKAFSECFSAFFKSILNFQNFQKKYVSHSRCISSITDSEKRG